MKTKWKWMFFVAPFAAMLVFPHVYPQQPSKSVTRQQAIVARDEAVERLARENSRVLQALKGLTREQTNAVVALLTIDRAIAAYESQPVRRKLSSMTAYYKPLHEFSPVYTAPAKFQSGLLGACFNSMVDCGAAYARCEKSDDTKKTCDSNPDVMQACGAHATCIANASGALMKELPKILEGRDPWPPIPMPY